MFWFSRRLREHVSPERPASFSAVPSAASSFPAPHPQPLWLSYWSFFFFDHFNLSYWISRQHTLYASEEKKMDCPSALRNPFKADEEERGRNVTKLGWTVADPLWYSEKKCLLSPSSHRGVSLYHASSFCCHFIRSHALFICGFRISGIEHLFIPSYSWLLWKKSSNSINC